MYQLIRQKSPIDDREFAIEFLDPGVEAFAFTVRLIVRTAKARLRTGAITVLLLVSVVVGACAPAARPPSAVAQFDVSGERFRVVVTDASTIAVLKRLQRGEVAPSIPNGRLVRGTGNEPWRWRLEDIEMADVATEVCDGTPSYVETHLDEFLAIGRYCPWAARLVSLELR